MKRVIYVLIFALILGCGKEEEKEIFEKVEPEKNEDMALPTMNITTSMVRNILGENTNSVSELCTSPNINKNSHPQTPLIMGTTNDLGIVEAYNFRNRVGGVSEPFRLGDFRGYEHDAEPYRASILVTTQPVKLVAGYEIRFDVKIGRGHGLAPWAGVLVSDSDCFYYELKIGTSLHTGEIADDNQNHAISFTPSVFGAGSLKIYYAKRDLISNPGTTIYDKLAIVEGGALMFATENGALTYISDNFENWFIHPPFNGKITFGEDNTFSYSAAKTNEAQAGYFITVVLDIILSGGAGANEVISITYYNQGRDVQAGNTFAGSKTQMINPSNWTHNTATMKLYVSYGGITEVYQRSGVSVDNNGGIPV